MKMISVSTVAVAISFSLAFSSGALAKEKDDDAADSEDEVTIEKVTLVREAGDKFEPVKSFKPSDTFGVLVKLSEPKNGTRIKAVWMIVDAGGMQNKKVLEKEAKITPEAIKGVKEPSRIDFTLTHDDPYPTGDYKADIYLNGELAETVEFKIR